jgi:hypothetical protein
MKPPPPAVPGGQSIPVDLPRSGCVPPDGGRDYHGPRVARRASQQCRQGPHRLVAQLVALGYHSRNGIKLDRLCMFGIIKASQDAGNFLKYHHAAPNQCLIVSIFDTKSLTKSFLHKNFAKSLYSINLFLRKKRFNQYRAHTRSTQTRLILGHR